VKERRSFDDGRRNRWRTASTRSLHLSAVPFSELRRRDGWPSAIKLTSAQGDPLSSSRGD